MTTFTKTKINNVLCMEGKQKKGEEKEVLITKYPKCSTMNSVFISCLHTPTPTSVAKVIYLKRYLN